MQALSHAAARISRQFHKAPIPIIQYGSCTRTGPMSFLPGVSISQTHRMRWLSVSSRRTSSILEDSNLAPINGSSTIYALSTGSGKAAIAIIRISGPACTEIYRKLCPNRPPPKPRFVTLRTIYDPLQAPTKDSVLDSGALVVYFPAASSVTGEDVLELHVHGGTAIVKSVLSAIPRCIPPSKVDTIRYAEPGEFTRRAFMNDRLDLTQVEALGDTLSATTEQQRRLSVRGTTSGLAKRYESWRQQLLHARGELEALIDFSEDQHFDKSPAQLATSVADQVKVLRRQIQIHIANAVRGELLRRGITISLLGAPNVGKSSLLNRIVGREAAIVSKEAGTTRDVVEVGLDIGGWYCRLGDMAGLRTGPAADKISAFASSPNDNSILAVVGEVEQEGIKRAKQRALESDIVIVVLSIEHNPDGSMYLEFDPVVQQTVAESNTDHQNVVVVVNKVDRLDSSGNNTTLPSRWTSTVLKAIPSLRATEIFPISCRLADSSNTNTSDAGGIQAFLNGLIQKFQKITSPLQPEGGTGDQDNLVDPSIWQESLGTTERQRLLLEECLMWLDGFIGVVGEAEAATEVEDDVDIVVAAEGLRGAAECLARITGRGESGDVEEVLGVIFEKFCVGK